MATAVCQQDLKSSAPIVPALKTEVIEMVEKPGSVESEYHFWVSPREMYRDRHFLIQADRTVCKGMLTVNGTEFQGEDATDIFRFDRANVVSIFGCLERVPAPLRILAVPKVFVSSVKLSPDESKQILRVEVTVRNTLLNSATCTLTLGEHVEELFVGPETSQTRSFFLRLEKGRHNPLTLELYKFEEAMAGAYRHLYPLGSLGVQR